MKVTGRTIMELLSKKKMVNFVKDFFDPLKDSDSSDIYDCCRFLDKDRSALMNGKVPIPLKYSKLWAERIKNDSIYKRLIEKIAGYQAEIIKQQQSFRNLFEKAKTDKNMPIALADKIEQKFDNKEDCEAILLLFLWSIYMEDISLLSFLYNDTIKNEPQDHKHSNNSRLLSHMISSNPIYIGHDELINNIRNKLTQGSHFVFLQGMGGIGKTESAKQYAKKYMSDYDTIVFSEFNSSLIELLNDNTVFTLTAPFESERLRNKEGMPETDAEFYQRKLTALRCAVNERTLLILDNVDVQDPMLPDFLTGLCHVIVTTRWDSIIVYPEETLQLDEINDIQVSKEIFTAYYQKDIQDCPYVDNIITYFSGHILALELTAKQMRASNLSAEEMWNILSAQNEGELEEGFLIPNKSRTIQSMTKHIQQIFNLTGLSDAARYIMSCLSLMPKSGLHKKEVRIFCGLKNYTELNSLIQRSWLRELDGIITMHTLIKETVQINCRPTLHSYKSND